MTKNYFKTEDHDKLVFIPVPKILAYSPKYRDLSPEAKWLYTICIDLIQASMRNHGTPDKNGNIQNWKSEKGFYVQLSIKKIEELLGYKKDKIIKMKKELAEYDLIDEDQVGLKKPNLIHILKVEYTEEDIYVVNNMAKSYAIEENYLPEKEAPIPSSSMEVGKTEFKKSEKPNSGSRKNRIQEVGKTDSINNKSINNKSINNKLNNVCVEEQRILDLIESRKDLKPHTQKLIKCLEALKEEKNFKYEVFQKTLEIINVDVKDLSYLTNALTNNIKKGECRDFKVGGGNRKKGVVPDWIEENDESWKEHNRKEQEKREEEKKKESLEERRAKLRTRFSDDKNEQHQNALQQIRNLKNIGTDESDIIEAVKRDCKLSENEIRDMIKGVAV